MHESYTEPRRESHAPCGVRCMPTRDLTHSGCATPAKMRKYPASPTASPVSTPDSSPWSSPSNTPERSFVNRQAGRTPQCTKAYTVPQAKNMLRQAKNTWPQHMRSKARVPPNPAPWYREQWEPPKRHCLGGAHVPQTHEWWSMRQTHRMHLAMRRLDTTASWLDTTAPTPSLSPRSQACVDRLSESCARLVTSRPRSAGALLPLHWRTGGPSLPGGAAPIPLTSTPLLRGASVQLSQPHLYTTHLQRLAPIHSAG